MSAGAPDSPLWRRLLWFGAIYGGSVVALGVAAAILRTWLKAA